MGLFFGMSQQRSSLWAGWAGLTAYFAYNENTGTATANKVTSTNATLTSNSIWTSGGKVSNGFLTVSGSVDKSVNFNSRLGTTDVPITISYWIKEGASFNSAEVSSIFAMGRTTLSYDGWINYYYQGNMTLQSGNGTYAGAPSRATHVFTDVHSVLGDGNWHHVVCQISAYNNQKLYIDGTEWTTKTTSGTATSISWGANEFHLFKYMAYVPTGNIYFDELACWNRIITTTEITQLYNSGTGLFY